MKGVEAPRLITDSPFANFGNTLLRYAQDGLDYNQKQRQLDATNAMENKKFDYQVGQDSKVFDYGAKRDVVKDNQWQQDFEETKNNNLFDRTYKTDSFNHTVNQDNIKNSQWSQAFSNTVANQNKPDYSTFNGVDAQGNPTLNMVDKNTGKVVNTGAQVYNEAKRLAPEQSAYYQDRTNEMKQKNIDAVQKNLSTHPAWSNLSEEDKVKAVDYVNTNGKLPEFKHDKSTLGFGGGFSLALANQNPINNAQSLEEVGKQIDSLGSSTPKYYAGINSRDLVLAKRWAENPDNKKYIADVWNINNGTLLERYNQYGKGNR